MKPRLELIKNKIKIYNWFEYHVRRCAIQVFVSKCDWKQKKFHSKTHVILGS
jgi:hypothetical protein